MKVEKFAWWFRLIAKILIPVLFFVIANTSNLVLANAIAGVMVIVTLFYYVLVWQKLGEKKV